MDIEIKKRYLKRVKTVKNSIRLKEKYLEYRRNEKNFYPKNNIQDAPGSGDGSSVQERYVLENYKEESTLLKNKLFLRIVNEKITSMKKEDEKVFLKLYYLHNLTMKEVAKEMYCSEKTIQRLSKRALKNFPLTLKEAEKYPDVLNEIQSKTD